MPAYNNYKKKGLAAWVGTQCMNQLYRILENEAKSVM